MARAKGRRPRVRASGRPRRATDRYTVDASVFVNAFNPHEAGHAGSLALLTEIHERSVPVILPALVWTEIASAIARTTNKESVALDYADASVALPEVSLIALTPSAARDAARVAAAHRLRGADAVYASVARRYATTLVTRDEQQLRRASAVVSCLTPEEALLARRQ
jgi:predicted nucleic acid-binding protein